MSVVLRCPNCGTTGSDTGECAACHDAEVRYFCNNHTPGLWLDASLCSACGARFGVPDRSPPVVAPPSARTRSSKPPPTSASTRAPVRPRTREPSFPVEDERAPLRTPLWQALLQAALRARYLTPRTFPHRERTPIGRGVGGCLGRLVVLVLLLLLALAGVVLFLGRSLLGGSVSF
jgi:hypothetical protein